MSSKQAISLLKETYTKWSDRQAPRLGASVAFYSILSFAPLLVLITALIALVFGHESAQGALINEARELIGERGADTVQTLLKNAQKPASGVFASLVAFVTLLFGASGVFSELQDALNVMWDVKSQSASGFIGMIRQRLFSFGMVLSVGFLLLVLLILSAGLAYIGRSFGQLVTMPPFVMQTINFVVSFAVIAGLFGLMFKYVPAAKIPWKDVLVGAVGTALLFTIGKQLLGLYLGKASVGSPYGAAGSLVAVVVWIYYSAQIFFFGAEFTRVYAEAHPVGNQPAAKETGRTSALGPVRPQQVVQTGEVPMRTAATVGSTSPVYLPVPTATAPDSAQAGGALPQPNTGSAETMPLHETPRLLVTEIPAALASRTTKPRLVMAAAVGFALGRVFAATKSKPNRL
jgi:membrane protein